MSSNQSQPFTHQQREREKADPRVNQEHLEIHVERSFGRSLHAFLQKEHISAFLLGEEMPFDIIKLAGNPDFELVERLIKDWIIGKDLSATIQDQDTTSAN